MAQDIKTDPVEQDFRKKHQWYAFTSKAWGALGMASFFGALGCFANGLIGFALKSSAGAGSGILTEAAGIFSLGPLSVIGGLAAFGLLATYMSQRAETEANILQTEHQARQNAKCMAPAHGIGQTQTVEYAQNQRSDGRTWQESLAKGQPQVSTQLQ